MLYQMSFILHEFSSKLQYVTFSGTR